MGTGLGRRHDGASRPGQSPARGLLRRFDLPLGPAGSAFQKKAWAAIAAVPWGEVRTYGEIASRLGSSPRAVGAACRTNPLPIVVPCHRVVGAQGALIGPRLSS